MQYAAQILQMHADTQYEEAALATQSLQAAAL